MIKYTIGKKGWSEKYNHQTAQQQNKIQSKMKELDKKGKRKKR